MIKTMQTQPLRCIRKSIIRPFVCFYSSIVTPYSPSTSNPRVVPYQFPNPSSESHEIASSFRVWFRSSKNPTFDRVFEALNSNAVENLTHIDLGLQLSESVVLDVLRYKSSDVLSCLKFFDWAGRQSSFRHTRVTYVAIFKIVSRAKLHSLTLDWLDGFSKTKFVQRARLSDILVVGYSLAGKLDVALLLFGKIRFRGSDLDSVSYHVLLNALVDAGFYDAVKVVLDQIRARGLQNEITNGIVIKSMCKQGLFLEAEEYMRDLLKKGEVVSGRLFSILVDGLCKAKMISHAGKLVHEFAKKGGVPMDHAYGVWIRGLVHNGKLDEALKVFNVKKSLEGYIPDVYRYNALINKLLKEDRLQEVCDLLMDMRENNIAPDKVTMSAVLCFFCKAGMMDVAIELFKGSSEFGLTLNSLVYNYIVNTLCGDGNTNEAFQVLKSSMSQGFFPGSRTFAILADALCREGKLDKMKDLIIFALERKFMPSRYTYEKFIRALCRARRVEDGYLIHGELNRLYKTLSDTTYAYLIYGFNKASRGDLAGRLLIEMQEKGHKPTAKLFKAVTWCVAEMEDDKFFLQLLEMQLSRYGHDVQTYSYFIYGAGHARKPELGRAVFEMMEKYSLVPSLDSDIFMLQCFLKSDRIGEAMNFFHDIPRRRKLGRKLYNSMVVGLCKVGKADYAASVLRLARKNGQNPSLNCYEELIKLYCAQNNFDQAIRIINELEKAGRKISSFIGNCLLLYSLHSGDVYRAWLRSKDVTEETPSGATLGQLVAAFSDRIRVDSEVEDLEEVIRKCFPLDLYTYNMLLRKLSIDHIDKACQLFKRICQKGIKPNRWTYDILVRGLYKHGRIAEGHMCAEEMHRRGYMQAGFDQSS
ncbi:hypothetical protein RND81_10G114000 [Saponaria officinalis]|uniref:Pentatricopeptide repeat-containing protein n=1 Tax=Saponaria officinalis TaxID=3572 RepID=A0AAW1I349_SAPOF